MRIPTFAAAALLAAALPALALPAAAQGSDPVVARVGADEVRRSEVEQTIELFGQDLRGMPAAERFETALDRVIDARLITQAARKANLDDDPDVKRQMRMLEDRVLQQALIARTLKEATSEKALRETYDRVYNGGKGMPEVHARHILVDSKAKAEAIIKELNEGGDFAALAEKNSKDSTAKRGGDLGFFGREDMVKPFADAAFALKPGSHTKAPVESEFGWHVIKVEETRTDPAPPFERVRKEMEQRASQAAVADLLEKLRRDTKVEVTEAGKAAAAGAKDEKK